MLHADRAARLVTVVAAVAWLIPAPGCGSKEAVNDPLASHSPALITETSVEFESSGRVVSGPSNIARFSPTESAFTTVNAADISLRQVLDDLGPDATLWYQHVQALANPFFEGRAPGTRGSELTADYVEFYFRQYGLTPAFTEPIGYRQPFDYVTRSPFPTVTVDGAALEINGDNLTDGEDFVVLGNSASGEVTAPLSFVGYGIGDGPEGYTSFDEDTDLTGRIALLLRYAPLTEDGDPRWESDDYRRQSSLSRKMSRVAQRGAAAVLMVNPPGSAEPHEGLEPIQRSRRFGPGLDIPAIQITPEVADRILSQADPQGRDLMTFQRLADEGEITTVDFDGSVQAIVFTEVDRYRQRHDLTGQNVGGVLPGKGALADEWIVIGAHHDHVGVGTYGGVMPSNRGQLHPGADDNASGTAGVLILARKLSEAYADTAEHEDLRSVLFLTFDAEEMGLHGSDYFANNPTIDPEATSIMLNMDMIGRLRSRNLSVLGTGTAEGLPELLTPLFESSGLTVSVTESGSGRSDESNFHRLGIPGMHFFTGVHKEYTSPDDQAWTVNPGGAAEVLDLIYEIAMSVAARPERLAYRQPPPGRGRDRGYGRVRLGIRPGMGDDVEFGVLVDEVYEETSAAEGGIQPGDIMISWCGSRLESPRDLFQNLQQHEPGDVVTITVLREGEEVECQVTLKASRRRSAE
ncbi:MAG: M28 family peptidase [Planctomycetota bacterium]|jgi:hypothetical protein